MVIERIIKLSYTHSIAVGLCEARYMTKGQMLAYLADPSNVTGNEIP